MKNLLYLALISFLIASCNAPTETLKITEPTVIFPQNATFKGNILGNNVVYQEKVDNWINTYGNEMRTKYEGIYVIPLYLTPIFNLERNNLGVNTERIGVKFPSLNSTEERNDMEFVVNQMLSKGKKELLYSNTNIDPSHLGKIDKFIFEYLSSNSNGVTRISTIWGEQSGSTFEIVNVKEVVPTSADASIIKTFLVTFNVDCKMYEQGGKYVGNIKGLLTYRWDYRLFKL